jgi:hypothetical protein
LKSATQGGPGSQVCINRSSTHLSSPRHSEIGPF